MLSVAKPPGVRARLEHVKSGYWIPSSKLRKKDASRLVTDAFPHLEARATARGVRRTDRLRAFTRNPLMPLAAQASSQGPARTQSPTAASVRSSQRVLQADGCSRGVEMGGNASKQNSSSIETARERAEFGKDA